MTSRITADTFDEISFIKKLIQEQHFVALYNETIFKVFHAIPHIEWLRKPIEGRKVIYISCSCLEMEEDDWNPCNFGTSTKVLKESSDLYQRIIERDNIPQKEYIALD